MCDTQLDLQDFFRIKCFTWGQRQIFRTCAFGKILRFAVQCTLKLGNYKVNFSSVCSHVGVLDINETVVGNQRLLPTGVSDKVNTSEGVEKGDLAITVGVDYFRYVDSASDEAHSHFFRQADTVGKRHHGIVADRHSLGENIITICRDGHYYRFWKCSIVAGVSEDDLAWAFFTDTFNILLSHQFLARAIISICSDRTIHLKEDVTNHINFEDVGLGSLAHSWTRRVGFHIDGGGVFARYTQVDRFNVSGGGALARGQIRVFNFVEQINNQITTFNFDRGNFHIVGANVGHFERVRNVSQAVTLVARDIRA